MAEVYIGQVFTGASETLDSFTLPKPSLIASSAAFPFVPAVTNSLESIIAGSTQKLSEFFTGSRFDTENDRNLIVEIADSTLVTINDVVMIETVATYTFRQPAPPEVLAALKLKANAL